MTFQKNILTAICKVAEDSTLRSADQLKMSG